MRRVAPIALVLAAVLAMPAAGTAASLRGSPASMQLQNQVAKSEGYTFIRTPEQVAELVEEGYLVPVKSGANFEVVASVSFPYARPVVHTFLERLSSQYREACGERLVVTSLTRPRSLQPPNAHALSVHPTGMAVDLRVSENAACRGWLEGTLLSLENKGLLDVTRERRPPHYHVAVFPEEYGAYAAKLQAAEAQAEKLAVQAEPAPPAVASALLPAAPPPAPAREARPRQEAALLFALLLTAGGFAVHGWARRRQPKTDPTDDVA